MLQGQLKYFGQKYMLQVLNIALDPGNGTNRLCLGHMRRMIERISALNQLKALNIILQITWVKEPESYESGYFSWDEEEISSIELNKLGVLLKNLRKLEKFSVIAKEEWYPSAMGDVNSGELIEALALNLNPYLEWLFVCPVSTRLARDLAYHYRSLKQFTFQNESDGVKGSLDFLWFIPSVNCGSSLETCTDSYDKIVSLYYQASGELMCADDAESSDKEEDRPGHFKVFKEILNKTGKTLQYLYVDFRHESIWGIGVENWIKAFYERVSDTKGRLILNGLGDPWTNTNLGLPSKELGPNDEVKDSQKIKDFLEKIEKAYPNVTLNPNAEQWTISIVNQCCERAQLGLLKELYDQRKPLTQKSARIVEEYIKDPSYEMGAY